MSQAEMLNNTAFEENLGESSPENTTCTNIEPEVKEMSQVEVIGNQTIEENMVASEPTTPVATITPFPSTEGRQTGLDMEAMASEVKKLEADLKLHDSSEYAEDKLRKLVEEINSDQRLVQADHIRFLWYLKIGMAANAFMAQSKAKKKEAMRILCKIIGRKSSAIISYMRLAKYTDSVKFVSLGLARLEDLVTHINNLSKLHGNPINELEVGLNMLKIGNNEPMLEFAEKIAAMSAGKFNKKALILLLNRDGRTDESKSYQNGGEIKLSQAKSILRGKTDKVETEVTKRKGPAVKVETIEKALGDLDTKLGKYLKEASPNDEEIVKVRELLTKFYNKYNGHNDTQQSEVEQQPE